MLRWLQEKLAGLFSPARAKVSEEILEDEEEPDFVALPIEDFIDLHSFSPRETRSVVEEYLREAHQKGFREVRIIHGRGKGVQRRIIQELLARHPLVASFADAPSHRGGWGATIAQLKDGGYMSPKTVAFFFDYSCPYAYLASTQIESLCTRNGALLRWRPMLLGGIFRELGAAQNQGGAMSPPKARHNLADMKRWASLWEVPLSMPSNHPMRTVTALRATLVVPEEERPAVIHAIYRAYWVDNVDISDPDVLRAVLDKAGQDGGALLGAIDQRVKDELRAHTEEALARGVFGAPSVFLGEELYWGQDRLFMVEEALGGRSGEGVAERSEAGGEGSPAHGHSVDFWFDLSSPFAYLASTQIEALCTRNGALLRPRPMFLGGVFKALDGPIVPLSTFSPAKQRYVATDIARWARHWGVPFQWPSRFPMMTVKPLRIALSLGEDMLPFVHACFRAYWAEDRDLDDEETLRSLLREVGHDPERFAAAKDPAWKDALTKETQVAVEAGVFGAPTLICDGEFLFWGQDRLSLVERFLQGWRPPA